MLLSVMNIDITLALQVIGKIFSGMFLTGEGIFVVGLFVAAGIAFALGFLAAFIRDMSRK